MNKWFKFINEQKDSTKVAKAVLFNGNKILLLMSAGGRFKGQLDLPGGHLHYDEDPIRGLQREVQEETGLLLSDYRELHQDGDVTFFWGPINKEEITLSKEHSAYYFLSIEEIGEKGYKMSDVFMNGIKRAYEEMSEL